MRSTLPSPPAPEYEITWFDVYLEWFERHPGSAIGQLSLEASKHREHGPRNRAWLLRTCWRMPPKSTVRPAAGAGLALYDQCPRGSAAGAC